MKPFALIAIALLFLAPSEIWAQRSSTRNTQRNDYYRKPVVKKSKRYYTTTYSRRPVVCVDIRTPRPRPVVVATRHCNNLVAQYDDAYRYAETRLRLYNNRAHNYALNKVERRGFTNNRLDLCDQYDLAREFAQLRLRYWGGEAHNYATRFVDRSGYIPNYISPREEYTMVKRYAEQKLNLWGNRAHSYVLNFLDRRDGYCYTR